MVFWFGGAVKALIDCSYGLDVVTEETPENL